MVRASETPPTPTRRVARDAARQAVDWSLAATAANTAVARDLAFAFGYTHPEAGTCKAIHAVLDQLDNPLTNRAAWVKHGVGRGAFKRWKKLLVLEVEVEVGVGVVGVEVEAEAEAEMEVEAEAEAEMEVEPPAHPAAAVSEAPPALQELPPLMLPQVVLRWPATPAAAESEAPPALQELPPVLLPQVVLLWPAPPAAAESEAPPALQELPPVMLPQALRGWTLPHHLTLQIGGGVRLSRKLGFRELRFRQWETIYATRLEKLRTLYWPKGAC